MMGSAKFKSGSEGAQNSPNTSRKKVCPMSDSDSDCLVIDVPEEQKPVVDQKPVDLDPPPKIVSLPEKNPKTEMNKSLAKAAKSDEDFDDVENAMAAMFAGCESESGGQSPKKTTVKVENPPASPKKRGRKPKTGPQGQGSKTVKKSDPEPKKYVKKKKHEKEKKVENESKNRGKKRPREEESNSAFQEMPKFGGPFVRVTGSLENPFSVKVINSASDVLDPKSKLYSADFDLRLRVTGFGPACSSTLSSKYDPKVVDETWICVFCKMGSHAEGLGDLFGPYFVRAEVVRSYGSPNKSKQEIAASFIIGSNPKKKKRGKGAQNPIKIEPDVSKPGGKKVDEEEVWFHEDCICWNPEVRLVGSHIFGMEEAIARTQRSPCSVCHFTGSTLCCIKPGCHDMVHYHCANSKDWQVNENLFQAYCQKHAL